MSCVEFISYRKFYDAVNNGAYANIIDVIAGRFTSFMTDDYSIPILHKQMTLNLSLADDVGIIAHALRMCYV